MRAAGAENPGGEAVLPRLREDLQLMTGGPDPSGAPQWLIYDPVQHRYSTLDQRAHDLLSLWPEARTLPELSAMFAARHGQPVSKAEAEAFLRFLEQNSLVMLPAEGGWRAIWSRKEKSQHGILWRLLHNYLFFRIPLVRPERILQACLPWVMPLMTRRAAIVAAIAGLLGLYLVSRQWDAFTAAAGAFWSFEGALLFAAGLLAVKALHELGHAFTAVRYGCRVPTMGVAVMLLAPLLYTDVTDVWRLPSKKQRIAVAAAGVIVELAIACYATLAWALLPDGTMKSLAFVFATAGWIMSLAVNLNPFMRFDGYYMAADALGIDNLQDRALEMGRWRMREFLFALGDPPPERFAPRLARLMSCYAYLLWIYRLVLFTGIALLVYGYFFKLLGILLFAVEIGYFIVRPLWREAKDWWRLRQRILNSRRSWLQAGILAAGLALLIVPWSTRIAVPVMVEAAGLARHYPPHAAEVVKVDVRQGDNVAAGAPLLHLRSAPLEHEIALTGKRIALNRVRLARRTADAEDRSETLVLERERRTLEGKMEGLMRERDELILRAAEEGRVLEIDPALVPGRFVAARDLLAVTAGKSANEAAGYVSEEDRWRIEPGAKGWFIPDDAAGRRRAVEVTALAGAGEGSIGIIELASVHGGPIAVTRAADGRLTPDAAQYLVRLAAETPSGRGVHQAVRGIAVIQGRPASYLARLWRHMAGVLVRESSF